MEYVEYMDDGLDWHITQTVFWEMKFCRRIWIRDTQIVLGHRQAGLYRELVVKCQLCSSIAEHLCVRVRE
jgi:hypothetical protein